MTIQRQQRWLEQQLSYEVLHSLCLSWQSQCSGEHGTSVISLFKFVQLKWGKELCHYAQFAEVQILKTMIGTFDGFSIFKRIFWNSGINFEKSPFFKPFLAMFLKETEPFGYPLNSLAKGQVCWRWWCYNAQMHTFFYLFWTSLFLWGASRSWG